MINRHVGLPRPVRGALVGVAVAALLQLCLAYAERRAAPMAADPEIEGLTVLAEVVITTVMVWVPLALVVGWLVGWTTRLAHPLTVSFVGMVGTGLSGCLLSGLPVAPPWPLTILIVATYAVTPVLVDLLWANGGGEIATVTEVGGGGGRAPGGHTVPER